MQKAWLEREKLSAKAPKMPIDIKLNWRLPRQGLVFGKLSHTSGGGGGNAGFLELFGMEEAPEMVELLARRFVVGPPRA